MSQEQLFKSKVREWRACPPKFVREVFKVTPDDWQDEALEALTTEELLAVRACKGPGKTAFEAWAAWWFETCFYEAQIATVAITKENLRDNLWKEIAYWHAKSQLVSSLFEWQKERVVNRKRPATWWISARAFAKDADPEQQANTLAGLHSKYVAIFLDEAGGIPQGVADAAEGVLMNLEADPNSKAFVVLAGNPTHTTGPLYKAFEMEPEHWWRMHVTADPNFKVALRYKNPNSISRFSNRCSQKQAARLIKRHGRKSAVVMVNVLGDFPLGASDAIISMDQFRDAFTRYDSPDMHGFRVLGVDVARLGSNQTVLCPRYGNVIEPFITWQGNRTPETARKVKDEFYRGKYDQIRIDDVGAGGGVTDILLEEKLPVIPIDVGSSEFMSDDDKRHHLNLRSVLYHDLQAMFLDGGIALHPSLEEETRLVEQGNTLKITYAENTNKRKIESKISYKKRCGMSPDELDALMLACADRVAGPGVGAVSTNEVEETEEDLSHLLPPSRTRVRLLDRRGRYANLR